MPGVFLMAVVIIAGGWFVTLHTVRSVDRHMRKDLTDRAVDVVHTINVEYVKKLAFMPSDENLPEFRRLNKYLVAMAEYPDEGFSKVYTVKLKAGGFVFGPEGYGEGDPSAVPPGTVYKNPPPELKEVFIEKKTRTAGPYADEFGEFISVFVPVIDPLTGDVLVAVGIDDDASIWREKIRSAKKCPVSFTLLLLAVLFASRLLLNWRGRLSEERRWRMRYMEAYITLAAGLVLTAFAAIFAYNAEVRSKERNFNVLARTLTDSLKGDLSEIRVKMRVMEGFFRASDRVDRQEFDRFAEPLSQDGIVYAWIWAPAVPAGDVKRFERQAQSEGFAGYGIFQMDEAGRRVPVSGRDVYYPNFYRRAPLHPEEGALGFDFGSEPVRRDALETSLRTGLPTSTVPITLFALEGTPSGLIVFQYVRSGRQKGFITAGIKIRSLVIPVIQRSGIRELGIVADLFYLDEGRPPELLFSSEIGRDSEQGNQFMEKSFSVIVPVFAFGRTYAVRVYPSDGYLAANKLKEGWMAGLAGLLLTGALTFIASFLSTRRAVMEREISMRTAELEREIAERKKIEARIRYLSFHDTLTQLYNRAYLEEEMERLDTKRQLPISVIMADLNGLKKTNDTHGHAAGDDMLKSAAEVFKKSCRKEDLIARWGGDEFVVFLPNADKAEVLSICERITRNSSGIYVKGMPVSIACGSSTKNTPEKPLASVMLEAEENMYKHKFVMKSGNKDFER